ncbi:MAG: hypothetical protein IKK45_07745 [Akkermansia sp.]|nr:hypothetical protein [Akkermansia sp.]
MKSYTIFQKSDDETVNAFLDWMRNQERGVYRAALRELSALKKLRPQFMQQKPLEEQFAWLKKMLSWKPAETIADHLLQVWLIRKHEKMLVSFIEKLGIAHNGHGVVDVLPETLEEEPLKEAVDALFAEYPAGAVSIYLQMFQNQTETGWPELQAILDSDPRVTIK